MSFLDIRFPTDIDYGFTGGPTYQTDIKGPTPKDRIFRSRYPTPVYEYTADLQRIESNIEQLISFFRIVKGSYHSFRFKDWIDYKAENQNLGVGNNVVTDFQLQKAYTVGSYTDYRKITKPVDGSLIVKLDGISTSAYTIDTTSGVLTFDSAPGIGVVITADFEFDAHVRFAQDKLPIQRGTPAFFTISQIQLIDADS